jgi:transcriptional regulator with XRE-family HTH domain
MQIMGRKINDEESKSLGARLRQARLSCHETLEVLASATGVHHGQISRIERGEFRTISPNVQNLCDKLRVPSFSPVCRLDAESLALKLTAVVGKSPSKLRFIDLVLDALDGQFKDPS